MIDSNFNSQIPFPVVNVYLRFVVSGFLKVVHLQNLNDQISFFWFALLYNRGRYIIFNQ